MRIFDKYEIIARYFNSAHNYMIKIMPINTIHDKNVANHANFFTPKESFWLHASDIPN